MTKALKLIAGLLAYFLWRVSVIAWWMLKLVLFFSIVWGFLKALTDVDLPMLGALIFYAKSVDPSFYGSVLVVWISENWISLALAVIFLNSILGKRIQLQLNKTSTYTKLFMASVLSYLNVQPEVPASDRVREVGLWNALKERYPAEVLLAILGMPSDESLYAKAKRNEQEVQLVDDIKAAVADRDVT